WFLIALGLFNGIGFSFVFWATYNGRNMAIWTTKILQFKVDLIIIYFALNVILMLSVLFGWFVFKSLSKKDNKISSIHFESKTNQKFYRKMRTIAWGMLIISIPSYILYARAYGGFSGLIYYSRMIRSGIPVTTNKFS